MEFERKKYNHSHMDIAPACRCGVSAPAFFMLTSHLMQEPAIKIKLPESKTAEAKDERVKTILITKNGEIYFMDKKGGFEKSANGN